MGTVSNLALSLFQWFWIGLLTSLVGLTGIFFLYVATQLFRNPGRRPRTRL